MKRSISGVPFVGAPLFFLWLLAGTFQPAAATDLPAAPAELGNTATAGRLVLTADLIEITENTGGIRAEGNVRLWYADLTLTATTATADLEGRVITAQGEVALSEAGRRIDCAFLRYDLATRSAQAEGILFASHPWYYQGSRVDKIGDNQVVITEPLFTTCNCRRPHFHLRSRRIEIVLGDAFYAYDSVLYVGATPVFYLPYVWRSLKDNRPPFSIGFGYTQTKGWYGSLRLNYLLTDNNAGSALFELMERKGQGLGLDQHVSYALAGRGEGDLSLYYIKEKDTNSERFNGQLQVRHEFSERDWLQVQAERLSYQQFNQDYFSNALDSFQQKSFLSYSHRGDGFFASILAQDTEVWDPVRELYFPEGRQLPGLSFSLSPLAIGRAGQAVYLGAGAGYARTYQRVTYTYVPDGGAATATAESINFRFLNTVSATPTLTQSWPLPLWVLTQPALSWSFALPMSGAWKETAFPLSSMDAGQPDARFDAAYQTSLSLINKWVNYQRTTPTYLLQSRLVHSLVRRISHLDEAAVLNQGISSHQLGLGLDYQMGTWLNLQADTAYSLLPVEYDQGWLSRLADLTVNGQSSLGGNVSLNGQLTYPWLRRRVSSAFVSAGLSGARWNLSLSGSYALRSAADEAATEAAIFTTASGGYRFPFGVSVYSSLQFDITGRQLNALTLGMAHDLHCWEAQGGVTYYQGIDGGRFQYNLGMTLKAFPQVTLGNSPAAGFALGE